MYQGRRNTSPEAGSAHVRCLLYIRHKVEEEVDVVERVRVWLMVWTVLEVDVSDELRVVIV